MTIRLAIASDHAGYEMKEQLRPWLEEQGHAVLDLGAHGPEPSDYPDFAAAVAAAVLDGRADRGILLCGSGVGASIAANKVRGIRAALAHDAFSARQCVVDDDANVLCLGPRVIGVELARVLITIFVDATFSGLERHRRRLEKVALLERAGSGSIPPAD